MTKKKRPKRPNDRYHLPPHVAAAQRYAAKATEQVTYPRPPPRRVVVAAFGMSLLCLLMALFFWMPARSLVHDLRTDGVIVEATVTAADNKPKYIRVRYAFGVEAGKEFKLSEYAGMLPELRTGDALLVIYDRKNPSRVLPHDWVTAPPPNLPAYGTSGLSILVLGLSFAVVLRRRRILRASTAVRLTKP
ncbi:DUF3592 domain-containing protein [Streptomyces sp. EMB24]|uniref:DUF3592 domain-containing protein n=1 Tax=Streptomyces sp. EMB24 TaxID=2835531 RepID=UPI00227BFE68|nr:DUF3592 domain-containing protein [Streptomyces sp. EMB24]